jgi:hypothetical protein
MVPRSGFLTNILYVLPLQCSLVFDIGYKLCIMAGPAGGGEDLRNEIFSADLVERGCYLLITDSFC